MPTTITFVDKFKKNVMETITNANRQGLKMIATPIPIEVKEVNSFLSETINIIEESGWKIQDIKKGMVYITKVY